MIGEKKFHPEKILKVALIGPESSGKTFLCEYLSKHYNTNWVKEYARDYIASLGRKYTIDDILFCTRKQLDLEKEALATANKILFCDTELIIASVWLKEVFNQTSEWLEKLITGNTYDLYLLTAPDIPFIHDSVRENPHRREYFFELYKDELKSRKLNFKIIEGDYPGRIILAIKEVDDFLNNST